MDTDELSDTQKRLIHAGIDVRTADWPDGLTADEPEDDLDERLSWYERQRQVAEGVEKVLESEEESPEEEGENEDSEETPLSEEVQKQKRQQIRYGV
ncbi:hypothetical protein [Salinibacter altiplanensis]|uniref:hypothetical protein n=1 Tax=Salinibacter altiplanensis TaxID=1803181 RepID=UPI000C9F73CC|nr:hypothetical protein [Salinibacter altiplanensis]